MITYINFIHITLAISTLYAVYIFAYELISKKENRFTMAVLFILICLNLSEWWSLARLVPLTDRDTAVILRVIQLTLYQLSLLYLAYVAIKLRRQESNDSDNNQETEEDNHRPESE